MLPAAPPHLSSHPLTLAIQTTYEMTHLTFYSAAVHVCPTLRSRRQVRGCYRLFHLFPVSSFIGGNLVSSPFWKPGPVADLILFFFLSFPFHDSEREQAKESQYVRQREAEKLKEAKAKLAEAQAEVVSRLFRPPIRFPLSPYPCIAIHPHIHPSNHPIIVLHGARCIG